MPEPSPELSAVLRRAITAFQQRDLEALESLLSHSDALRLTGTDPREWWRGYEAIVGIVGAQLEELPPFELSFQDLEGFEDGNVGWAAARFVQLHGSEGTFREESLGVELTTTLEDLLESLGPETDQQIRSSVTEGPVPLMFTDIEGSSEISEQIGDQAWAELIGWHDDMLHSVAESEGGTVVKTLGDGAMLAFESARSAVRSAVKIQEAISAREEQPPLQVRIGVHTGETVRTDTDYLGHTVNKAARIASAADGSQIMVSDVVLELVGDSDNIHFGQPIPVELKGLTGTHLIIPVDWQQHSLS